MTDEGATTTDTIPADPFDHCEFYDARDNESLSCDTPEEALEEIVDDLSSCRDPGQDLATLILQNGPVTVKGYNPRTIPDAEVEGLAEDAFSRIDEHLSEEYGNPDGDGTLFHKKSADACLAKLTATIREICDTAHVWACEVVAKKTYTAEEVLAIMRKEAPEWFEKEEEASS